MTNATPRQMLNTRFITQNPISRTRARHLERTITVHPAALSTNEKPRGVVIFHARRPMFLTEAAAIVLINAISDVLEMDETT